MTGRINVVFKFWNQLGLCGILKLINLILEKMLTIWPKSSQFLPMYNIQVKVKQQANQSFLKCDCLHYERCGIPFTHVMKITNQIDETMITVQHQEVFLVHFGLPDSQLSDQLMKAVSMQILYEDLGMPISIACLENALHPKISM
jgi:hypothetical protein